MSGPTFGIWSLPENFRTRRVEPREGMYWEIVDHDMGNHSWVVREDPTAAPPGETSHLLMHPERYSVYRLSRADVAIFGRGKTDG